MNMDSMGYSFEPYEIVFCDFCGGNHFTYYCTSNPDSSYFIGDSNWDTSHFNGYTQSWEDHPNLFLNNQDHGTFTSPTPPYQDWSNNYANTFDQSWEEQVDFSESFQGDDFNNSFLPPTPSFEQAENSESLKTMMNDFTKNLNECAQSILTSIANMSIRVEEINRQNQIPIPSEIENFECIGKDEDEVNTLENSQEMESYEEEPEHLSNPSSLQNSEEVQQNAKIVINPYFESVQEKIIVADAAAFVQQCCAENLQVVSKKGRSDQSTDSGIFIKSSSIVGEVVWKNLWGMTCSPICSIKILCRDQPMKHVVRNVYKHKWKEKHQFNLVSTVWAEEHTDVLQQLPPLHNKLSTRDPVVEKEEHLVKRRKCGFLCRNIHSNHLVHKPTLME